MNIELSACQTFLDVSDMKFMASDHTNGCSGCYFVDNNARQVVICYTACTPFLLDQREIIWLRIL